MVGCIIVSFKTVYFISFFPTIPIIYKYIKYYYELKEIGDKEGNEHLRREDCQASTVLGILVYVSSLIFTKASMPTKRPCNSRYFITHTAQGCRKFYVVTQLISSITTI